MAYVLSTCDDCGSTENVNVVHCPYADKIIGIEVEVQLCPDCYCGRLNSV